ncbi:hypothetical protein [Heyndrickxia coagulans]|uniref:hypothetical protein n=1 Tax=Heyndrickxia coagulans TaxID=1398 RepID=UPI0023E3B898|nr:hypothetical protein [Heyndrickxia coagulans]
MANALSASERKITPEQPKGSVFKWKTGKTFPCFMRRKYVELLIEKGGHQMLPYFLTKKRQFILLMLSLLLSIVFYFFIGKDMAFHLNGYLRPDFSVDKKMGLFIFPAGMVICLFFKEKYIIPKYFFCMFFVIHLFILFMTVLIKLLPFL